MTTKSEIISKLNTAFEPSALEVIDESELHRGHAGWREGGGTHFRIRIAADKLGGLSRVAQHRAIMDSLSDEFAAGLHALAIEVK
ncbi:BolA family protein [Cucumibacter marinus]|uniref:BolA family protein n=1 Tax=Cucumibacter marinus TaxID=1121252 RepID=UPI0004226893|nr:BolA family protein [Cucumibacter marinus]